MIRPLLSILAIGLVGAGCNLTPHYQRPSAPLDPAWPGGSPRNTPATSNPADAGWRTFFTDPRLQRLIEIAIQGNLDLKVAALRIEQARAEYRIQGAALYPGVAGNAGMLRQRTSGAVLDFNGGAILSTYNVNLNAAYEIDLFGRVRSLKQEALEKYFATGEARRSVQIALVSQVATEYLTQLRLREAKAVANRTLESVRAAHELIRRRFEAGAASELELRSAETQVQSVRVNAADYLQQLAESEHALSLLLGQPLPADLPAGIPFAQQQLLGPVPAGIPSEVLQQRPDILAAEHTLKAANANIGAARAAFFPRILLTGSGGTATARLSDLFTGPSGTWSFGPQINVPIFEAGSTRARLAVAKIEARADVALYQKAIQNGFREVADALATRAILDEKVKAQESLLEAQRKRFELAQARQEHGIDSHVEVLLAQQDLYAAEQNILRYQAARLLNTITLYRSLGGGWEGDRTNPSQDLRTSTTK